MTNKWFAFGAERENASLSLLLFPFAGGCPSAFVQWKNKLTDDISIYPVQYPFREARRKETLPDTVRELAETLVRENEAVFSGKYAVFAHCAGAAIAYETVLEARKMYGTEPEFMIVSGAEPPEYSLESLKYLSQAEETEFLDYLISRGFADESVRKNSAFLSYYLPIIKADFTLMFSYIMTRDEEPLHCPLYIFRGDDDKVIDVNRLEDWKKYTTAETSERIFDGGHYYFTNDPDTVCAEIGRIVKKGAAT